MDMSDSQLAAMAGRGDGEAYRKLFERYQHPIYNFVYRMVDNAEDASDIVQNAFIKVYTVLGEKEIGNFSAYLYRTARNLAYDEIRRRRRFVDVDHEVLAPEDPNIYADPQRALALGEQIGTVRRAMGNLNENHRAALMLRELQDLDYDQMAEVLDSNRNAVGALLSRARLRLREELRMAQIQTEQIPPECEEIITLLSPYIDRELPEGGVVRVEEHLSSCTFCSAALEEMQEASRSCRIFIPVVPPPDIAQAVTGRISQLSQAGPEATSQVSQAGLQGTGEGMRVGPTKLVRMLRSPFFLGGLAALFILGGSALLLADRAGERGGEPAISTPAFTSTGTDTVNTSTGEESQEAATDTGPAAVPPADQPEAPVTPAAFGILGGFFSPSPAEPGDSISFTVDVTGQAASVSCLLVDTETGETVATVALSIASSGTESQQWTGSRGVRYEGSYQVRVEADGLDGGSDSTSLGTLTVRKYGGTQVVTP